MLHRVDAGLARPISSLFIEASETLGENPQRQKARLAHTNGCNLPDSARTCRMGARLRRFPRCVNCQAQTIAHADQPGRTADEHSQDTAAHAQRQRLHAAL